MPDGELKLGKIIGARFVLGGNCRQDAEQLEQLLRQAARQAGARALKSAGYDFEPQGASAVLLLGESHYAVHSWPERNLMTAVFYTCGEIDSMVAVDSLAKSIKAVRAEGVVHCFDSGAIERFERAY